MYLDDGLLMDLMRWHTGAGDRFEDGHLEVRSAAGPVAANRSSDRSVPSGRDQDASSVDPTSREGAPITRPAPAGEPSAAHP